MLVDMVTDPGRAGAYRRAGHWDDSTLSGRLAEAASREPTRPAVVDRDGDNVHSYAELGRDVAIVGAWLEARGVGAGDVVSIQLPNWYEFVVLAVATQRVGGVINPLLPIYRRKELLHAFTVAESKVVCTPAHYRNFDHLNAYSGGHRGVGALHRPCGRRRGPTGTGGRGGGYGRRTDRVVRRRAGRPRRRGRGSRARGTPRGPNSPAPFPN